VPVRQVNQSFWLSSISSLNNTSQDNLLSFLENKMDLIKVNTMVEVRSKLLLVSSLVPLYILFFDPGL
jgi:hypothetical protein